MSESLFDELERYSPVDLEAFNDDAQKIIDRVPTIDGEQPLVELELIKQDIPDLLRHYGIGPESLVKVEFPERLIEPPDDEGATLGEGITLFEGRITGGTLAFYEPNKSQKASVVLVLNGAIFKDDEMRPIVTAIRAEDMMTLSVF